MVPIVHAIFLALEAQENVQDQQTQLLSPLSNTLCKQIKFKRKNVILYSCNTIVSKKHIFEARLVVSTAIQQYSVKLFFI